TAERRSHIVWYTYLGTFSDHVPHLVVIARHGTQGTCQVRVSDLSHASTPPRMEHCRRARHRRGDTALSDPRVARDSRRWPGGPPSEPPPTPPTDDPAPRSKSRRAC